jgi:prevent-host-death family protein
MAVKVVGSREARTQWRDVLDTAQAGAADVVIERNGRLVAAIISYEDYQAIQEDLDDLRTARRAAEIYEEWKRDPSTGRPYSEVRDELKGLLDE